MFEKIATGRNREEKSKSHIFRFLFYLALKRRFKEHILNIYICYTDAEYFIDTGWCGNKLRTSKYVDFRSEVVKT